LAGIRAVESLDEDLHRLIARCEKFRR
jgi:hypothetical protein